MSLVSIIVPVYNAEEYLAECIESVINQKYKNIEVILIDDGSKDRSLNICNNYKKMDDRITVISQPNKGVSAARNTGIEYSKGDYIIFVDSDDFVTDSYCDDLLEVIKDNESVGMVVQGFCRLYSDNHKEKISYRINDGIYNYEEFMKSIIDDGSFSGFTLQSSCGILYRKDIIEENHIRFREAVKFNEDGLFSTEYFFASKKNVYINFSIADYFYRVNYDSASQTNDYFGDEYKKSQNVINDTLKKYDSKWNSIIQIQLYRRSVTIAVSKILYLNKLGRLTIRNTKSLLENENVHTGLRYINKKILNKPKCMFYYAIRYKMYWLIVFSLKIFSKGR